MARVAVHPGRELSSDRFDTAFRVVGRLLPVAEQTDPSGDDLAGFALRLHNGPLQNMFAGIMILEGGSSDATATAIEVLRQGVRDLNEIIESLSPPDGQHR